MTRPARDDPRHRRAPPELLGERSSARQRLLDLLAVLVVRPSRAALIASVRSRRMRLASRRPAAWLRPRRRGGPRGRWCARAVRARPGPRSTRESIVGLRPSASARSERRIGPSRTTSAAPRSGSASSRPRIRRRCRGADGRRDQSPPEGGPRCRHQRSLLLSKSINPKYLLAGKHYSSSAAATAGPEPVVGDDVWEAQPSVNGSRVPPVSSTQTDLFSRYSLTASTPFSRPRPDRP